MNFKTLFSILLSFTCIANGTSSLSSQIKTISDKAGNQFEQLKKNLGLKEKPQKAKFDMQVRKDLVLFLSRSPDYKGKPNLQKGFLDRLQLTTDISDAQRETVLNMIKQRELQDEQNGTSSIKMR